MGKTKDAGLSAEELEIRQKEDAMFEALKAPPSILEGVMDVLGDAAKSNAVAQKRSNDKKRRLERESLKATKLKNAFEGYAAEEESAKKKRAPRKAKK